MLNSYFKCFNIQISGNKTERRFRREEKEKTLIDTTFVMYGQIKLNKWFYLMRMK